jgi:adenylate kinase
MIIALTGTPGTGKTSVAEVLKSRGFEIVDLNKVACENNFILGKDKHRDSNIVDIEKFNNYVVENYISKDFVLIEGHLSHLLKSAEKIIILRCHPDNLKTNLSKKGWKTVKIKENIEAEILDIILCESIELHKKNDIFEIDVTNNKVENIADIITDLIKNKFKSNEKYKVGRIDWSEEILKEF